MSTLHDFRVAGRIRFQHCDPAGIAFFARLDELLNACFEDWCAAADIPFARMMGEERIGFPLAHASLDYRAPLRLGDEIEVQHRVVAVGRTSVTFAVAITRHGIPCVEGRHVRVMVSMDAGTAVPLPDALRAALASAPANTP